ncbi:MAG: 3-hydroxy-3-methylglutaryl-CoA reductase, partial [Candidatus Riflebacteria bacterium]|nr:3-hydroxy-3-methylglutaryl-CoA reductase [Candidatus Riflebacteria bacterium]
AALSDLEKFSEWINNNFAGIKKAADATTKFGKLLTIEQYPIGTQLVLRMVYSTGDASGQNMTTIATRAAIEYILNSYDGSIYDWFLESNLSGDKKVNAVNFTRNRGKKVVAVVKIPAEIVKQFLHTTPERIMRLGELTMITSLQAHSYGVQAHYANMLAAVYIAAGQDPACVAESACGVTYMKLIDGALQISVTLPDIMVGTVGGGTRLPTQKKCLEIMQCAGPGKAKKLAEILAATVLAGEISITGAMASDEFTNAHAKYGRSGGLTKK